MVGNDFVLDNKAITALLDVLATLGENAAKEVLAILKEEQYKINLHENKFSHSKQDVETALREILGRGGDVVVMLWNEKLEKTRRY